MLLCAREGLSPEALIQAMAKSAPQQKETMTLAKLVDICSSLVVLGIELNVLRFAHISFQAFLETNADFAPARVHKVAAIACLDSCLEGLPVGMETYLSPVHNFYHYSAIYWAEHCRNAITDGADGSLVEKIQDFVFDGDDVALSFVDWTEEVNRFEQTLPNDHALAKELYSVTHSGSNPLFTACVFGIIPIIDNLAYAIDYDWNQANDLGQSGLYLAAAAGRTTIVQRLLQYGVEVNISGGRFGHPLHAACFAGHTDIVTLLLRKGADPRLGSKSAMEHVLRAGHEDIALLLLNKRLDISNQAEYDSHLQKAAEAGFAEVVQLLQKKQASLFGYLGSSKCRALEVAIFNGRARIVERYIHKLSNPKLEMPEDAIAAAALGGQDSMISLHVDQGLDLNKEGMLGTPLRAASVMGHEPTVRLLLEFGARLSLSGSFGEPLQSAATQGHAAITGILLFHGADVNSKGGLYGTAIQAVAHRGHQKIVEMLLEAGADVHQEGFSRDAFHAASEGGHEGIVLFLLEKGFKLRHAPPYRMRSSFKKSSSRNLLREASPSRSQVTNSTSHHDMWTNDCDENACVTSFGQVTDKMRGADLPEPEMLHSYRAQHYFEDENYALQAVAAKGHIGVVKLLLSQLHKMDVLKSEIFAALKEVSQNGHEKVASLLLSDRIEVKELKLALEYAAMSGHLRVVDCLIDRESRLGLARAEIVEDAHRTLECDATTSAVFLSSSKGGHLPVFRRG